MIPGAAQFTPPGTWGHIPQRAAARRGWQAPYPGTPTDSYDGFSGTDRAGAGHWSALGAGPLRRCLKVRAVCVANATGAWLGLSRERFMIPAHIASKAS